MKIIYLFCSSSVVTIGFIQSFTTAAQGATGPVCSLYESAQATGSANVAQNLQNLQQVPALLGQSGQAAIEATGQKSATAGALVAAFNQEALCGTQFVQLTQDQYNQYTAAGNPPLSTFGLPVTGTISVAGGGAYAGDQILAPGKATLADFTTVALLSMSQSIQNTILTVNSSLSVYQNLPPVPSSSAQPQAR